MARLEGKRAIVTGAGSGVGRIAAIALAREGAHVLATDADESAAAAVAEAAGGKAIALIQDVTSEKGWDDVTDAARKELGGLDILVHGAGRGIEKGLLETTLEEFQAISQTNVEAFFMGSKAAVKLMRECAGEGEPARGSIISLGSVAGLKPLSDVAALSITHDSLRISARSLGVEVGRKGRLHPCELAPFAEDARLQGCRGRSDQRAL